MNRPRILLVLLLLAGAAVAASASYAGSAESRAALAVRSSTFGRILFDGRSRALYAFTRDPRGRSACSGACAAAWPPFLVRSRPDARTGISSRLVGTTRRADGKLQVTYAGRPLYYYVGDRKPREVRCQNVSEFGGVWLVVRPNGQLVK
jgi:predicted lipoprotein with Yx(FWY)xxD motif